ncbi:MAG TPA: hypothetical protein VL547_10180 [Dinghuibacter sp.]|uniref:DinB family protein n=1 Tax=Dinghuibacter sp. TaxID=2024697 RepID=UPI002C08BFA9|nr:hypothetical protein [Dinghuibacter sp.]HTJ12383.1 hypothetical protein [Dinghuibacter sp.]
MKNIDDPFVRAAIISRIESFTPDRQPLWGKMTAPQMLRHCRLWEELALGRTVYPRAFIGRIFGRMAKARFISDDRPLPRNSPTLPGLIVRSDVDVVAEKAAWITMLCEPHPAIIHPFFGPLTAEEVAVMSYKHADHHLRQFGA